MDGNLQFENQKYRVWFIIIVKLKIIHFFC